MILTFFFSRNTHEGWCLWCVRIQSVPLGPEFAWKWSTTVFVIARNINDVSITVLITGWVYSDEAEICSSNFPITLNYAHQNAGGWEPSYSKDNFKPSLAYYAFEESTANSVALLWWNFSWQPPYLECHIWSWSPQGCFLGAGFSKGPWGACHLPHDVFGHVSLLFASFLVLLNKLFWVCLCSPWCYIDEKCSHPTILPKKKIWVMGWIFFLF